MTIPSSLIYVRPGLASYTWTYAGATMQSGASSSTVAAVAFDASSLLGQASTRGDLQYSTDNGRSWTTYAVPVDGTGAYVAANGTLWRFQDRSAGDSGTPDAFTAHYRLADGSLVAAETIVVPDNQPVGLVGANDTVFSTMAAGDVVDLLAGIDTGSQTGGRWVIENQSNPGLFSISYDRSVDTGARLVIANPAQIPQTGQAVSVTVHYHDRYQVDANGNPLPNTGVTRTLSYSVEEGTTDSLAGMSNQSKLGAASGTYEGSPALAALSGGGVVAVWQGSDAAGTGMLWAQLRDGAGNAAGAAFALTPGGDGVAEGEPAVTALSGGRFAVAYTVQAGGTSRLAYRVVEADGRVGAEHVAETGNGAGMATLATLSDGSFALGWRSGGAVHVQQVGADGNPLGAPQTFGALATAYSPSIAALAQGGWVVSWGEIGDGNVYAAVKGGAAFVASGDGYAASVTTAAPLPHVTALVGGGFVVAWDSYANDQWGFSNSDVFFQRFDGAGHALGGVVQANVGSGGGHFDAAITALSDGGFLVAWQAGDGDANGVYGRRFDAGGSAVDAHEFAVNQLRAGNQTGPDVKALAGGGFAAAWVDTAADGSASVEVRVLPGAGIAEPVGGGSQNGGAGYVSTPPAASAPGAPVTTAPSTPVTTAPGTPVSSMPAKLSGSAGHDLLSAPPGVVALDGLDGLDAVLYGGARAAYTVAHSGDSVVVSDAAGNRATLSNIERIEFSDQALALDIDGNAGQAYRLYQAAFDRTPDQPGLGFWIDALDQGVTLAQAAQGFVASDEFVRLYGANATDVQFVQALYQNVLHRAPDAAGYDFWLGTIDRTTRADVLVAFSESEENQVQVIGSIQDGIAFTHWG